MIAAAIVPPWLADVLIWLHPPHCHRIAASLYLPYFWLLLWPILLIQAYLLFHVASKSSSSSSLASSFSFRNFSPLLHQHARPIRLLLLIPQTILCLRVAFAYHFVKPVGSAPPPSWRIVGEKDFDFVNGIIAAYCWAKSLEYAVLLQRPTLDGGSRWHGDEIDKKHDDQRSGSQQDGDASSGAPALNKSLVGSNMKTQASNGARLQNKEAHQITPYYFPNTSIPLWIDLVFNLRGLGWTWGIPSPASTPISVPTTLSHPQTLRFLRSRLWTCIYLGSFIHFAHGVITSPVYKAAFDHPVGSLSLQPYSSSILGTALVQGCFVLLLGSMVLAPIQAVFSFLSLISVLLSPKTQYWWVPLPFDDPFGSTSLKELWGDRWHALFRRCWYICGYRPAELLASKLGRGSSSKGTKLVAILATFAMSGLFHELGIHVMRGSSNGTAVTVPSSLIDEANVCPPVDAHAQGFGADSFRTTRFFLLQGFGLILESSIVAPLTRYFPKFNQNGALKWIGWLWVVGWCALTGRGMVQTWIWHGFVDDVSTPVDTFFSGTLASAFVNGVVKMGESIAR